MKPLKAFHCKYPRNCTVLHLNVNSVRYKFAEISNILVEGFADVFVIGESKLDDSFTNAQFYVPNFALYRSDRNAHGGGGVMVYINNTIPHCIRNDLCDCISNGLEGMVFECTLNKKKWFISALYKPPSVKDADFESTFVKLSETLLSLSTNVMLIGDLNFNMSTENKLRDLCNILGFKNTIKGGTCFKGDTPTSLDVILVTSKFSICESLNVDIGLSDFHNLIGCAMKVYTPQKIRKNNTV